MNEWKPSGKMQHKKTIDKRKITNIQFASSFESFQGEARVSCREGALGSRRLSQCRQI
jgi:hypothetical protein